MRGCNATNGELIAANFARPLPWIGLYVAAASLLCAVAMLADAIRGFRSHKLWFPCKYFSLHATTLTLIAIATKLPVDLSTSMPGRHDQLSKLSGTVFLCIVIGNFMPSLGTMDGSGIAANAIALAILVITVLVNICIQMGTGVIYVFWFEHIVVMLFLVVILATLVATAFTVPVMKRKIEEEFDSKIKIVCGEKGENDYSENSVKEKVEKIWLMAHTGSPQYVVGRSATCIASGAFCLAVTVLLIEAYVKSLLHGSVFCRGVSDYGWSTKAVFYSQATTILVGSVAPVIRWFNARSFRSTGSIGDWSWEKEFAVEDHWVKWWQDWKGEALPFDNSSWRRRKVTHIGKNLISALLIKLQQWTIRLSKFVRILSVLPLDGLTGLYMLLITRSEMNNKGIEMMGLRNFVMHLAGEDDLVDVITRSEHRDVTRWIEEGKKRKPTKVMALCSMNSRSNGGFAGLVVLDRNRVDSLLPKEEEPPSCWAMPIVTLVAIAMALPDDCVDRMSKRSLLGQVYQGLRYVRLIEKHLECKRLANARVVADILWTDVEIHLKWFDVDLHTLSRNITSWRSIVNHLAREGKSRFNEFWNKEKERQPTRKHFQWPGEIHAYYCMYKVATNILGGFKLEEMGPSMPRNDSNLFHWIRATISDVLRACLTNVPRAVHMECVCNKIEEREERVRNAAFLLGEAECIFNVLAQQRAELILDDHQRAYIDEWIEKILESRLP